MSDFWKDVKKTATKAGKIVSEKTKAYSKIAGLKLKLADLKIAKNKVLAKLGESFYKYSKRKKLTIQDKKIQDLIKEVSSLVKKESKYKKDIADIKGRNNTA